MPGACATWSRVSTCVVSWVAASTPMCSQRLAPPIPTCSSPAPRSTKPTWSAARSPSCSSTFPRASHASVRRVSAPATIRAGPCSARRASRWIASFARKSLSRATSASSCSTPRPCRCVNSRAAVPAWPPSGRGAAPRSWACASPTCGPALPKSPCAWSRSTAAFRRSPTASSPATARPGSRQAMKSSCSLPASRSRGCWRHCTSAAACRRGRYAAS